MLNPIKDIYISGRRGRDHMVVGFATTCAISAYHHYWRCEFESPTWRGVFDTTCCDIVCQWLATGRWIRTPIGTVQGRIWHRAKFQNEQKTYLILERSKIIWVHDTRWVTFGCQTTEAGNNHGMKWPKSLL
jgi:hypothetical protein